MPSSACWSETLVVRWLHSTLEPRCPCSGLRPRPQDPHVFSAASMQQRPLLALLAGVCAARSAPLSVRTNVKCCQTVNVCHTLIFMLALEGISIFIFPAALVRNCVHLQIIKIPTRVTIKNESVLSNFLCTSREAWTWSSRLGDMWCLPPRPQPPLPFPLATCMILWLYFQNPH